MEKARDWMSRDVVTVDPADRARVAIELMRQRGLRHLFVKSKAGELRGLISDRDVVRVVLQNPGRVFDLDGCTTSDIMTPCPLITIGPDDSLGHAADLLLEHKISALPVIHEGEVEGVLTTSDLLRAARNEEPAWLRQGT